MHPTPGPYWAYWANGLLSKCLRRMFGFSIDFKVCKLKKILWTINDFPYITTCHTVFWHKYYTRASSRLYGKCSVTKNGNETEIILICRIKTGYITCIFYFVLEQTNNWMYKFF